MAAIAPTNLSPILYSEGTVSQAPRQDVKLVEEFIEKFQSFFTHGENYPQTAENLLKSAAKILQLSEIVDIIFKESQKSSALFLLKTFLIVYPSYHLSPHDKIRKAIIEGERYDLNNESLQAMFKEHGLDKDEEKVAACYELAYRFYHPNIYPVSQTPTTVKDYTLNFLWVNLNPQDRVQNIAEHIFGTGLNSSENADCIKDPKTLHAFEQLESSLRNDWKKSEELEEWEKITTSFTYRVSKWAEINPHAQIHVWYDSALVTQKAQRKTFEMLASISESRKVHLQLRDIRQLPNIKGEIVNALHPGTPVYFRVDLLKVLIADHMISSSKENAKYCVVSDIDVKPMAPERIFDQRTVDYLSSAGYASVRGLSFCRR